MEVKFYAEKTLGKLAKWLRILGFDTIFEQDPEPGTGKPTDLRERILLSRKKKSRGHDIAGSEIFIVSDHLAAQLSQVILELNLKQSDLQPFTRCIRCNTKIMKKEKEAIKGEIPDYVWESGSVFHQCERCGRIYWPGTHTDRSLEFINDLFSGDQTDEEKP